MLGYFKKRKAEKVFNELFSLLDMPYSEFNKKIKLTQDQKERFLKSDLLEKNVKIHRGSDNNFYITSLGLMQTICNLFAEKDMYFILTPDDKIAGLEIKK